MRSTIDGIYIRIKIANGWPQRVVAREQYGGGYRGPLARARPIEAAPTDSSEQNKRQSNAE